MQIEQRYCSAITSSDLRVLAHRTKDVDIIMAHGMSGSRLGCALMRLHTQYDSSTVRFSKIRLLDVMLYMPDLPRVYAGLSHRAKDRGIEEKYVGMAIEYWLDRNCRKCGGTGHVAVSGVVKVCPKCNGTGRRSIPGAVEELIHYINDCCASARGGARKRLGLQ